MQNGELLVAERLSPLGELRLQKGWRYSAREVLRATFDLRLGDSLAKSQDRHEADHQGTHKSYHRTLPACHEPTNPDADLPGLGYNLSHQARSRAVGDCAMSTLVLTTCSHQPESAGYQQFCDQRRASHRLWQQQIAVAAG